MSTCSATPSASGQIKAHLQPAVIMDIARLQRDHQFSFPYQLESSAAEIFPDFSEQQIEEAVDHCLTMLRRMA